MSIGDSDSDEDMQAAGIDALATTQHSSEDPRDVSKHQDSGSPTLTAPLARPLHPRQRPLRPLHPRQSSPNASYPSASSCLRNGSALELLGPKASPRIAQQNEMHCKSSTEQRPNRIIVPYGASPEAFGEAGLEVSQRLLADQEERPWGGGMDARMLDTQG